MHVCLALLLSRDVASLGAHHMDLQVLPTRRNTCRSCLHLCLASEAVTLALLKHIAEVCLTALHLFHMSEALAMIFSKQLLLS